MPRESVYASQTPYGDDDPGRTVAEISWGRESGHVQIVTRRTHVSDGGDYVPPEIAQWFGDDGLVDPTRIEPGSMHISMLHGWWCDLDRRGINDLIRLLRRARDHAYGKDE